MTGKNFMLHIVSAALGGLLVACGQVTSEAVVNWVAKLVAAPFTDNHNGPLELIVQNMSDGPYAMTEIRAGNEVGCFADFLVTGGHYNDPGNGGLTSNEASVVSESTCARFHVKANAGDIRFTTVAAEEANRIDANVVLKESVVHMPVSMCNARHVDGTAGYLCASGGELYWVGVGKTPEKL